MKKVFFICFVLFFSIQSHALELKGNITIRINDFRNDDGEVRVALFKSEDGFPEESKKAYKAIKSKIKNKKAEVVINDILFGEYAVAIIHDENLNGDLDSNFLGIPKEGYGASNNSVNKFGPPKFEEAKFKLNSEKLTVDIKVQY